MKNNKNVYRIVAITLAIAAVLLTMCLSVFAEEVEIIPGREEEIDITISEENSSYVYLDAEVPEGWGGLINVSFQNTQTGRRQSVSLSYLENEYRSGIWLRFGRYRVVAELPDSDGMCLVMLKDPDQKMIEVKKGSDISLTVTAEENPDFDFTPPEHGEDFVPPHEMETDYNDLPVVTVDTTESAETTSVPTETETEEEEIVIEEENSSWMANLLAILLLVIVIVAVIIFISLAFKQNNNDD